MDEPRELIGPTRRVIIGAGLAGAAVLFSRPAMAQQARFSELDETLTLLQSTAGVKVIYARFSLAFSLTLDLALRDSGAETENPASADSLPVLPADRPETQILFGTITELSNTPRREEVLAALTQSADPLGGDRGEALASLLNRVAGRLAEQGLPVDEGPIADALRACGDLERIAAVRRGTDVSSSFFCGYFPFSFFC